MSASLSNWLHGSLAIVVTVLLQYAAQVLVRCVIAWRNAHGGPRLPEILRVLTLVFVLLIGHLLQSVCWALVYLQLGHIETLPDALYFSLASYTTIGTNDISLSLQHRALGAVEAAMGVLMFGWSTALITTELIRSGFDAPQR